MIREDLLSVIKQYVKLNGLSLNEVINDIVETGMTSYMYGASPSIINTTNKSVEPEVKEEVVKEESIKEESIENKEVKDTNKKPKDLYGEY